MTPYDVALIDPARPAEALLGAGVLGVEITDRALAAACGLGNMDPQHGFGGGGGRAAIEAALDWPVPPPGARLVTLRPDADALGAMAILQMRADGAAVSPATISRVALVARHDAFESGTWTDWVAAAGPLRRPTTAADVARTPVAYRALTAVAQDRRVGLADRVAAVRRWLEDGVLPAGALAAAHRHAADLADAWNDGRIEVSPQLGGRLVLVRSAVMGALQLGYRFAPVILAETGVAVPRKVTISQFSPGWLRLAEVRRRLDAREAGWGGAETILGSPLGAGSRLPIAGILEAVEAGLDAIGGDADAGCRCPWSGSIGRL